jgi:hypothetical protein
MTVVTVKVHSIASLEGTFIVLGISGSERF